MAKITDKQFETILQTVIAEQIEAEIAQSQAQSSVELPDEAARERQWQAICASAAEAAEKRSRRTARRWICVRWAALAAVVVGLFAALVFNFVNIRCRTAYNVRKFTVNFIGIDFINCKTDKVLNKKVPFRKW